MSTWTDVTDKVRSQVSAIPRGELVCVPGFSLNEAMCSLELCAAKLDMAATEPQSFLTAERHLQLLAEKVASGEDEDAVPLVPAALKARTAFRLSVCLLSFLSGGCLQETVGSWVFCHPKGLERLREALADGVGLPEAALASVALGICRLAKSLALKGDVYEEDDFVPYTAGVNLLDAESEGAFGRVEDDPLLRVGELCDRATAAIGDAEGADGLLAVLLRALRGLYDGLRLLSPHLAGAEGGLLDPRAAAAALEGAKAHFEAFFGRVAERLRAEEASAPAEGAPAACSVDCVEDSDEGFDIHLYRGVMRSGGHRRVPFTRLSAPEALSRWRRECESLSDASSCMLVHGLETLRGRLRGLGRRSPGALARSAAAANLLNEEGRVFAGASVGVLVVDAMRAVGVPRSLLNTAEGRSFASLSGRVLIDAVRLPLYGRAVQRSRLERLLEDLAVLQQHAMAADAGAAEAHGLPSGLTLFAAWALVETARAMAGYLEAGLEAGLHGAHELDMVYFYLDYAYGNMLSWLAKLRAYRRELAGAAEDVFHPLEALATVRRAVCQNVFHVLLALRGAGAIGEPRYAGFSLDARYRRRFGAFAAVENPAPLTVEAYAGVVRSALPAVAAAAGAQGGAPASVDPLAVLRGEQRAMRRGGKLWTLCERMEELLEPVAGEGGGVELGDASDLLDTAAVGALSDEEVAHSVREAHLEVQREITELKKVCVMNSVFLTKIAKTDFRLPADQRLVCAIGMDETASGCHPHFVTFALRQATKAAEHKAVGTA